jgi:hypothetical protein
MSSNSELSIYAISKLIDELKNTDVGSLKNDIEKLTNLINTNTTNISTNSDEITDIKNSLNKNSTENTASFKELNDLITSKFAQKGSSTQPVYVDSTGTIQGTTFGLNSTVPADAKFTDTTYKLNESVSNNTLEIDLNSSASNGSSNISIIGSENISIENSDSTAVLKHTKGSIKNTLATTTTGKNSDGSMSFGGTLNIPTIDYDEQGHIVSSNTTDVVLPNTKELTITDGSNSGVYNAQTAKTLSFESGTNSTPTISSSSDTITVKYDTVDTKDTVGTTTKTDGDLYLVGVNDKTGNSAQSYTDGIVKINNGTLTVKSIAFDNGTTMNGVATAIDENVKQVEINSSEVKTGQFPILTSVSKIKTDSYTGNVLKIDELNYYYGNHSLCTPCLTIGDGLNLFSRSELKHYAGGTILFTIGGGYLNSFNGNTSSLDSGKEYPVIISKDMVEMFKTKGEDGAAKFALKKVRDDESSSHLIIRDLDYIKISTSISNIVFPSFAYCQPSTSASKDKIYGDLTQYNRELCYDVVNEKPYFKNHTTFSFYRNKNLVSSFGNGDDVGSPSFNIRGTDNSQYFYFGRNKNDETNGYFRVPKLIMGIDSKDRSKIIYSNNLKIKYRDDSSFDKSVYKYNYTGTHTDEYDTRMAFKSNVIEVVNVPLRGGKAQRTINADNSEKIGTNYKWEITSEGVGKFSNIYIKNDDLVVPLTKLFALKTEYLIAVINKSSTTGTSSQTYIDCADLVLSTTDDNNGERITNFINSVPDGSVITFAPGRYEFKDTIYITKAINLVGVSHSTIFVKCEPSKNASKGGTPIFKIGKYYSRIDKKGNVITASDKTAKISNVGIENIYFDSNNDYQTAPFIMVANLNGFYFKRNRFGVRRVARDSATTANTATWKDYTKAYFFVKVEQYLANAMMAENVWNFQGNISDDGTSWSYPLPLKVTVEQEDTDDEEYCYCNDCCVQFDFTELGSTYSMIYGASWEYLRYYKQYGKDMSQLILYGVRKSGSDEALVCTINNPKEDGSQITDETKQQITYKTEETTSVETTTKNIYPYSLKLTTDLENDINEVNLLISSSGKYEQFTEYKAFNKASDGYYYSLTKNTDAITADELTLVKINESNEYETYNIPKGETVVVKAVVKCLEDGYDSTKTQRFTMFAKYNNKVAERIPNNNNRVFSDLSSIKAGDKIYFEFTYTSTVEAPLILEFLATTTIKLVVYFDVRIGSTSISEIIEE